MRQPEFLKRFPGLLAFLLVLVLFLCVIWIVVMEDHRKEVTLSYHQHFEAELELLSQMVSYAVLRHDLPAVEEFLRHWGKQGKEILRIKAQTANGYVLLDYNRPIPSAKFMTHRKIVEYRGKIFLKMEIDHDLDFLERAALDLGWKLGVLSVLLTALMGAALWWILRQTSVLPLEREIGQRKQSEKELRKSQRDLQTIFETVHSMIWHIDKEHRVRRANQLAATHSGMELENIINKTVFDLFPEEFARSYHIDNMAVMDSGKPKLGIIEQRPTANGSIHWFQTDKVPYFNDHGEVEGITIFVTDITEMKHAEDVIRESEHRLREAQAIAQIGHWKLDPATKEVTGSDEFFNIFGLNREESTLDAFVQVVHPLADLVYRERETRGCFFS
jgi:PAS domain S-box-containing protein